MLRLLAAAYPALALAVIVVLAACSGPHPFLRQGDANSAEIVYSGDVASALPIARRHCAQYERVPRLADAGLDIAVFDCVQP
jgi:hypothetical protein